MSVATVRQWVGIFDNEEAILQVSRESRRRGFEIADVYAPYAVHGLDEAMGLSRSRLPWVCLICGVAGGLAMLWFATWTLAVDWPSNIGGKPYNSWPAIVPVVFEIVVLCGGYGVIFALLIHCRLLPGKRPRLVHPRVTNDRFAIVLHVANRAQDPSAAYRLFEEFDAVEIETRYGEVGA